MGRKPLFKGKTMFDANTLDETTTQSLSVLPTLPSHLIKANDVDLDDWAWLRPQTISEAILDSLLYTLID
jgi:hypothetical protein